MILQCDRPGQGRPERTEFIIRLRLKVADI